MYSYTFFERSPIPIAFCVSLAGITDFNDAMIMQNIKNLKQGFIQNYILSIISIMSGFEISLYNVLNIFQIPNIFIQSVTGAGHYFNNHNYRISNTVFTPLNSRLPVSNPGRITLNIHPLVERKLIESIDNFIIKFCQ